MTTLPVSVPEEYMIVVGKGDHVEQGEVLAKAPAPKSSPVNELILDLVAIYNESPDSVRKYLKKAPGDSIHEGDIIASHSYSLGLKSDQVIAHVDGTIIRFERDSGKLIIQSDKAVGEELEDKKDDILSPLAGTIKVCNNDSIVLAPDKVIDAKEEEKHEEEPEPEIPKVKAGEKGIGGKATGPLLTLEPEKGNMVQSGEITKETMGKILLLPDIEKEAIAKASAIGVLGILGTDLSNDIFSYVLDRKIDLPIISIDQTLGKKLVKTKKDITMNGKDQTVTNED